MSGFLDAFHEALDATPLRSERSFQAIIHRLLEYSIIVADDSEVERQLYEQAVSAFPLLRDWFEVAGLRLAHYREFRYLRLYPPGARIPGVHQDEEEHLDASALRERYSPMEARLLLVLRALYDQALALGNLGDRGEASLPLEEVFTAMNTMMDTPMPEAAGERDRLFKRLKRLKAIDYISSDAPESERWLAIRPMITTLVNGDLLADAIQHLEETAANDGEAD
ncbi:MAG TPA: DUF4194 domain-containing protein [Thiotrichales bacterium]|nr:DUF4194 domain-containing protein [Thiotrichales bacterium]